MLYNSRKKKMFNTNFKEQNLLLFKWWTWRYHYFYDRLKDDQDIDKKTYFLVIDYNT